MDELKIQAKQTILDQATPSDEMDEPYDQDLLVTELLAARLTYRWKRFNDFSFTSIALVKP